MKLNKTVGRVATTLVAGAMLTALAMPAYADAGTTATIDNTGKYTGSSTAISEISFKKGLILPDRVEVPDVTFTFSMTGTNEGQSAITDTNGNTVPTTAGSGTYSGSVTFGDADKEASTYSADAKDNSYTPSENLANTVRYTDNVKISLAGLSFQQPGVYKYVLTESITSPADQSDFEMAAGTYYIYLYAKRVDGAVVITGASMDGGSNSSKTNEIDNYYKVDPETGVEVGSLSFTKYIGGDMGNMSDTFAFTVSGGNIKTGTIFTVKQGTTESQLTATDNKLTFSGVGNNTTVYVYGLDAGTYTVSEDGADLKTRGYVLTPGGDNLGSTIYASDGKQVTGATTTVAVKENSVLTFTNNRAAVSPTGIVMNVAPYVLLVVVAAAGCFVFLRKRRED